MPRLVRMSSTISYVSSLLGKRDLGDLRNEHGGEHDLQFDIAGRYHLLHCARAIT